MQIRMVSYCTSLLLATCAFCAANPPARPSILLVTGDDLGLQLGSYGDRVSTTPQMDRLAREGMRFTQAFVTQASCSSSRSSMLTGLYPHQNGQIGLAHLGYAMNSSRLPALPGQLKQAGYRTGIIGKLHVAPEDAFAFDFKRNQIAETREQAWVEQKVREFLAEARDDPFFLMLNLFDPHGPFLRNVNGAPKVRVKPEDVVPFPFLLEQRADINKVIANFYTCINRMDEIVGGVMRILEKQGLTSNLVVVLVGDNGPPFPGAKCSIYEAGLQVPCIIWCPGRVPKDKTCDALVSMVDLMPTLLEVAGARSPANLPGRSLWPLLRGENARWRKTLAAEYTSHEPDMYFPQRSIRNDRYKLIVSLLLDPGVSKKSEYGGVPLEKLFPRCATTPPVALYDLKNDPYEKKNLAGDPRYREVLDELGAELESWRKATNDRLLDPVEFEKLTAWQIPFGEAYARKKGLATKPAS
jgi:N-sulfoglucosamine sulfohydrolase